MTRVQMRWPKCIISLAKNMDTTGLENGAPSILNEETRDSLRNLHLLSDNEVEVV